tara:strand:+ start:446237 stop:447514 length:1278 start_codon:yes stop_codon:yes gene_type:complete
MRYLPNTDADRKAMLNAIGVANVNELFADVPADKMLKTLPDLPMHLGEQQVEAQLSALARKNLNTAEAPSFIGAGSYRHHVPATVDYIIQRSEFLTAYTPYQPEIAQGTLMYLFEFQTYVANMTGMDVANASMYDGATSLAEAALMAQRVTKRKNITVAPNLHPHYLETLQTYMATTGGEILFGDKPSADCAAFIIQSPDFLGTPHSLEGYRKACDETGSMLIHAFTEVLSLGMLPAPAEADIVVGDGQSIGVGLNYGGPHLGLFACKSKFTRQMPGRLCGKTEDADGKESYVLTLNTREQHIRREKATSNICTNVGLCALAFTVHMSLLGEKGFKKLAQLNHERACMLADALEATGKVKLENSTFFNEFTVELTKDSADVVKQLAEKGILAGYSLGGKRLLVSATELTSEDDIATFAKTLKEVL